MKIYFSIFLFPYLILGIHLYGDTYVWEHEAQFLLALLATNGTVAGKIAGQLQAVKLAIQLFEHLKWPKPGMCNGPNSKQTVDSLPHLDQPVALGYLSMDFLDDKEFLVSDQAIFIKELQCIFLDSKVMNSVMKQLVDTFVNFLGALYTYYNNCSKQNGCPLPGTGKPVSGVEAFPPKITNLLIWSEIESSYSSDKLNPLSFYSSHQQSQRDQLYSSDKLSSSDEPNSSDWLLSSERLYSSDGRYSSDKLNPIDQLNSSHKLSPLEQSLDKLNSMDQLNLSDKLSPLDQPSPRNRLSSNGKSHFKIAAHPHDLPKFLGVPSESAELLISIMMTTMKSLNVKNFDVFDIKQTLASLLYKVLLD